MDEKKSAMLNAIGSEIGMTRDTVRQDGDSILIDYLADSGMIDKIRIGASETFEELLEVDILYSKAFMERYDGSVEPKWNVIDPKELYDRTDILDQAVSDLRMLQVNDRLILAGNDGSLRLFISDEEMNDYFEGMLTRKMQDINDLDGVRDAANALISIRDNGLTESVIAECGYVQKVLPAGREVMVIDTGTRKIEFDGNAEKASEEVKGFAFDDAMAEMKSAFDRMTSATSMDEGRRLLRNVKKAMSGLDSILEEDNPAGYFASKGWSFYEGRRTNPLRLEAVFQPDDGKQQEEGREDELPIPVSQEPQQEEQRGIREQGDAHAAEDREEEGLAPSVDGPEESTTEETHEKEPENAAPAREEPAAPAEKKQEGVTPAPERKTAPSGQAKIAGRSSKEKTQEFC